MKPESLARWTRNGLRWTLVTCVAALLLLMTVQIVLRYGFNMSLLWAAETCSYLLIWMTFLGVVLAFERGEVASLSFLSQLLPRVAGLIAAASAALLSAILCLLLVYYGYLYAGMAGKEPIPAMQFLLQDMFGEAAPAAPAMFWIYLSVPVGMALLALRLLADAILYLRAIPTRKGVFEVINRTGVELSQ